MPDFNRVIHLGLTVRDMYKSAEWYTRVLGIPHVASPGAKGPLISN